MSSKTIHVLGGGLWQVPTIKLAKDLGYRVFVTDMYEQTPGYVYADSHEVIDIRDRERTLDAARRQQIDGIICDTTDVGVPTAAYVAEQLGLPGIGYETALRFTNKHLMRQITAAAGVDNPRFALVRSEQDLPAAASIGFPLIVKPVDSQSSRGVRKVTDIDELAEAFGDALKNSNAGEVLVEEWIDGIEVTVEAMCQGGLVSVLGISDKDHYSDMPQVASRLTYPAAMDEELLEQIAATNARVIEALGLETGVTHAEYMVTRERLVYLVEIAARGGGTRIYTHIAPYLSGVPLPRLYLEYCLGETGAWQRPDGKPRAATLDFFTLPQGTVRGISGLEEARGISGVADLAIELSVGQYFAGADNDRARPGYVVAFGRTREEVSETAARAKATVRIEMSA